MITDQIKDQERTLLGSFLIVLLYSSLHLGPKFVISAGIRITPTDIVILVFLTALLIINQFRFRINRQTVILLLLIFACFLLEIFDALFRGLPRNFTLGIALLRNASLIFLVFQINYDQKKVSRWIIRSGVFFSIVALIGLAKSIPDYFTIINNERLWHPKIFYSLDSGLLRLSGLKGDPNFFFLINLFPLLLCLNLIREKKSASAVLAFTIILITSLLTFSRTGILLLGLLLFIHILKTINLKKIFLILFFILSTIAVSNYISETYNTKTPYDLVVDRFEKIKTGKNPRLKLWKIAWQGFLDAPVLGQGGRYVLRKSGYFASLRSVKARGFYAHNDYLEMLSSHGLTGFTLMSIVYLYILFYIKANYRSIKENHFFMVNYQLFFCMLIAGLFHLIYYSTFIWLPIALIFSLRDDSC